MLPDVWSERYRVLIRQVNIDLQDREIYSRSDAPSTRRDAESYHAASIAKKSLMSEAETLKCIKKELRRSVS